jgi:hypothetical protein
MIGSSSIKAALGYSRFSGRRNKVNTETKSQNHCRSNLPAIGRRHDLVLTEIVKNITEAGQEVTVNRVFPGSNLRPDNQLN